MDFPSAKNAFFSIINSLTNDDRAEFLSWCNDSCSSGNGFSRNYFDLRTIAEDIKTLIPTAEAIFPSEQVNHNSLLSESASTHILHVDSFLFEEEHIDSLVEEGKLSRNYCKDCGSSNVSPLKYISHSASVQSIEFIFQYLLPDLSNKVLLDIGSRLGAVLYGAYYCSNARRIIGVELNQDLCKLQQHIIEKYRLNDRIEVLWNNICNIPHVVQQANVIVLNNVFECFMPKTDQEEIWKWLRKTIINSGTVLVTSPSIEKTISSLQTGIDVSTWLNRIPITDPEAVSKVDDMDDQDMLSDINLYTVI